MSVEVNVGRLIFDVFESVKSQLGLTVVETTAGWDIEKSDLATLLAEVNAVIDKNANRASDTILSQVRTEVHPSSQKTKGKRK